MARGLAHRPPSCAEHPHHAAADHCDVCFRGFCRECLVRGGPQLLCRACWIAAPQRAAERARRRQLSNRLRLAVQEHKDSVIAGGIISSVLGLLVIISSVLGLLVIITGGMLWSEAMRAEMAEPVARAAAALGQMGVIDGGGPPPSQSGAPGTAAGATRVPTLLASLPQPLGGSVGLNPGALIDGRTGDTAPTWRTDQGRVAADLRFTTGTVLAGRALFALSTQAPPETWAKHVEVWTSSSGDDSDLAYAGRWTLTQTTEPQLFTFGRRQVRSVRLRILANHGSPEYTSLAEFALLAVAPLAPQ